MKENTPTLTDSNNMLDLEAAARHYARASLSDNTRRPMLVTGLISYIGANAKTVNRFLQLLIRLLFI